MTLSSPSSDCQQFDFLRPKSYSQCYWSVCNSISPCFNLMHTSDQIRWNACIKCVVSNIFSMNAFINIRSLYLYIQGVSKNSSPLKLFGIFSLRLSFFAWNFANLLAILYYQFLKMHRNISSNGVNFFTSTHRFHPVKFRVFGHKTYQYQLRKWRHFSVSCVLLSDNCKQSITVWFFTLNVLLTLF